jgi:Rod binding domain-containing protein
MSDSSIPRINPGQELNFARSTKAIGALRGAQTAAGRPEKIEKSARDFESLLLGNWLEEAEKSFAAVPGNDPDQDSDSTRDQFLSIACESLAQGLVRSGGLGIAKMICHGLSRSEAKTEPEHLQSVRGSHK